MNLSQMMQQNNRITIRVGCRWLYAQETNWIVNERLPGDKQKTKQIIQTCCEDTAVKELLKGKKIYEHK